MRIDWAEIEKHYVGQLAFEFPTILNYFSNSAFSVWSVNKFD